MKILKLTDREVQSLQNTCPEVMDKKELMNESNFLVHPKSLNRIDLFKLNRLTRKKKTLAFLILAKEIGLECKINFIEQENGSINEQLIMSFRDNLDKDILFEDISSLISYVDKTKDEIRVDTTV